MLTQNAVPVTRVSKKAPNTTYNTTYNIQHTTYNIQHTQDTEHGRGGDFRSSMLKTTKGIVLVLFFPTITCIKKQGKCINAVSIDTWLERDKTLFLESFKPVDLLYFLTPGDITTNHPQFLSWIPRDLNESKIDLLIGVRCANMSVGAYSNFSDRY